MRIVVGDCFLTFKHDDISWSEIDLVGASVKVFDEKRPWLGVLGRGNVQHVSNRV